MESIFLVWRMLSLTKAWVKIRTENISSVKFSHMEVDFASPSLFPEDWLQTWEWLVPNLFEKLGKVRTLQHRNGKFSVSGQRFSMLTRKEIQPTIRPNICQPNCKLNHTFQNTLLEFDANDPKYYQKLY